MILVHGISQEGKSPERIRDEWLHPMRASIDEFQRDALNSLTSIEAVFYGDLLAELSSSRMQARTLSMGAEQADDDFDEFAVGALEQMASIIGVPREGIEAEVEGIVVPMGRGPHKKWLKAIARAIEKVSPFKGTLALRVLSQAHAYIRNQNVHDMVNQVVRPAFETDEPVIIVSHSLGTVVSYAILRDFVRSGRPRQSPLWLTRGAPPGVEAIRKSFRLPRAKPKGVTRWVNAADPEDFVALRLELDGTNYDADIENIVDVENGPDNPHDIAGYLTDKRVAKRIVESIRSVANP